MDTVMITFPIVSYCTLTRRFLLVGQQNLPELESWNISLLVHSLARPGMLQGAEPWKKSLRNHRMSVKASSVGHLDRVVQVVREEIIRGF